MENDESSVGRSGEAAELARVRDAAHALKKRMNGLGALRFENALQKQTKKTSLKLENDESSIGRSGEAAELARVRDEAHAL